MNRNQRSAPSSPASVPPQPGWWLRVTTQTKTAGKEFNAGNEVTVAQAGPNLEAYLSAGKLKWTSPLIKPEGTPRDVPVAKPEPSKPPQVVIVEDPDPIIAWEKTRAASAEAFNNDWGKSLDALEVHPRGKQMADLYQRVAAERYSRQNNLAGRRIAPRL